MRRCDPNSPMKRMRLETAKRRFLQDLRDGSLSLVMSKWLIDRTPHLFYNSRNLCLEWKEMLAEKTGVDSHGVLIMGTASLGFSLNPSKNFKLFDADSDVDVAIISHHYFEISWHCLRTLGTRRYKLDQKQKASLKDHRQRLVYWGTVATDRILPILPFGREWISALTEMAHVEPTTERRINIRLYKDFGSLRAYHLDNLEKIRDTLLSTTGDAINETIPQYNA